MHLAKLSPLMVKMLDVSCLSIRIANSRVKYMLIYQTMNFRVI